MFVSGPLILGLWSIVLQPGQTLPQKTTPAIQITNISYGAEVKGDARSVVSIKYPEFEQDSDDEDDEEEDDEEEDEDDIKLPKIITKEAVLAVLKPNQTEQVSINISLVEDVEIVEFSVTGDNAVHLVGHYTRQEDFDQEPYSDSDDEEIDSDFDEDDEDEDDMEGLIGDDSEDEGRIIEIDEPVKAAKKSAKREASDEAAADEADAALSKNQKKKLAKKLKTETGAAAPAAAAAAPSPAAAEKKAAPAPAKPASRTLPGGLIITDSKVGTGAEAKGGKKVGMRYIGKLDSGKVFDSNTKGAPLVFNLGRGEVIKGWDQGVVGMKVGGERKLTIPAALAYGKKGVSGIPGGATLHFDVKLVSLK